MTREKFEEYIAKISSCVNIYESQTIKDAGITLWLSGNKKVITYSINSRHIAHLLGINTEVIREKCILSKDYSSYDLVKYLIGHPYQVYNKCFLEEKIYNPFSDFIDEKLSAFCKNIFPNFREIEAVIEFDKEKTYQSEFSNNLMDIDYFIVKKREENLYILGLKKETYLNQYYPLTSLEITDKTIDVIKKYFWKQNWYYVNGLSVNNGYETLEEYHLLYKEREDKIKTLQQYRKEFASSVCVDDEASFILSALEKALKQQQEYKAYIEWLSTIIKNPSLAENFPFETIYCNDQVVLKKLESEIKNISLSIAEENVISFSELVQQKDSLFNENENLKQELIKVREELIKEKEEKQKIELENDNNEQKLQRILTIVSSEKIDK